MIDFLPLPGMAIDAVDTPALLVDMDVLERNIETMHAFFRDRPAKVRSVTKGHKCPAIAQLQMTADGAVPYGLSCTKVSEAEVMVDAGAREIRMIEQVVGAPKLSRLTALARRARVIALADDQHHVSMLDEAAAANGLRLDVMIEVEIGLKRCGVSPGAPALSLARAVAGKQHLRFAGLHAHEGGMMIADPGERAIAARQRLQRLVDCRDDLEREGLDVEICGAGSTTTWNIAGAMDGITEIDPGSYALMDQRMADLLPDLGFSCALSVLATVISRPAPDRAVTDAGHKALGMATDGGVPGVAWPSGVSVNRLNSEHGILDIDAAESGKIVVGDKVRLVPRYHGSTVVAYDYFVAVRNGVVEAVWPITGRGAHQ